MTDPSACSTCEFDIAIIGAGPCGIAASISLASEGLRVVVLDSKGPGGQITTSSKIENVFGVEVGGVPGNVLMARGIDQTKAFGTQFRSPFEAVRLDSDPKTGHFTIVAANRERVTAASIVLALGVSYRRLDAESVEDFMGRGVAYGAPQYRTPQQWEGKRVGIVGGGNSAGQAALFLSQCTGCEVNVFVRGESLERDMSHYLRSHVDKATNIVVHPHTTLKRVVGDPSWMKGIVVATKGEEGEVQIPLDYLLLQIGAESQTGWLDDSLCVDGRGYIMTDRDIPNGKWPSDAGRNPYPFETSIPGVFSGGDVRANTPNRMSVAVGEGHSLAVNVYKYLEGLRTTPVLHAVA